MKAMQSTDEGGVGQLGKCSLTSVRQITGRSLPIDPMSHRLWLSTTTTNKKCIQKWHIQCHIGGGGEHEAKYTD